MSGIVAAVRTLLAADSGVSALVSSRIYPLRLPQNATLPAVVLFTIDGPRQSTFDGPNGLVQSRVQVDCYGGEMGGGAYIDMHSVLTAVRKALNGYSGTSAGVSIRSVQMDSERDLLEPETSVPRVSADFMIWHDEET